MNSIIRSVWVSALLLGAQAMADEDLGRVGESCRARSDCQRGLVCRNEVCAEKAGRAPVAPVVQAPAAVVAPVVAPRPMEPAITRPRLNPSLAAPMVAQQPLPLPTPPGAEPVFTSEMELPPPLADGPGVIKAVPVAQAAPGQAAPMPRPAPMVEATVEAPVEPEAPRGITDHNHFFVGVGLGLGPARAYGAVGAIELLAAPASVRVGGLFHFFEVAVEASPGLFVGRIAEPHFALGASVGAQITVFKRESFALVLPIRLGAAMDCTTGGLALHAQVVGLGLRTAHLLAEASLFDPHFIANTGTSNAAAFFPFALSVSYLF